MLRHDLLYNQSADEFSLAIEVAAQKRKLRMQILGHVLNMPDSGHIRVTRICFPSHRNRDKRNELGMSIAKKNCSA